MNEGFDSRKLAKAYVALVMAKQLATTYSEEQANAQLLRPALTVLELTTELLEDVLKEVMAHQSTIESSRSKPQGEWVM